MKILIIAAHPDDEILGCGGTISRLINEGHTAFSLILGEGITSRYKKNEKNKIEQEKTKLKEEMNKANKEIGIKKVFKFEFPDNKFDSIPLLDVVKKIEKVKKEVNPDIIFTHHKDDLNIDHRVAYKATITAFRPLKEETVRKIYSYEVLSSSEWNYPKKFNPNVFFDISNQIESKIKAMSLYRSEVRDSPHPRSLDSIKLKAKMWGTQVGLDYAEAFELVRSIL